MTNVLVALMRFTLTKCARPSVRHLCFVEVDERRVSQMHEAFVRHFGIAEADASDIFRCLKSLSVAPVHERFTFLACPSILISSMLPEKLKRFMFQLFFRNTIHGTFADKTVFLLACSPTTACLRQCGTKFPARRKIQVLEDVWSRLSQRRGDTDALKEQAGVAIA